MAQDSMSFKCAIHKHRTQCLVQGCCQNQIHVHTRPYTRVKTVHRTKRLCIVDGCNKQAHARQKCVRHGGGKLCKIDDCSQHARANGLCYRHRATQATQVYPSKEAFEHDILDQFLMDFPSIDLKDDFFPATMSFQPQEEEPLVRIASTMAILNTMHFVTQLMQQ